MDVWRAAPIPDVDSSGVCDRNAALLKDWPGLGIALDDLLGERVARVMEILEALLGLRAVRAAFKPAQQSTLNDDCERHRLSVRLP
jgi:hypothetical protein